MRRMRCSFGGIWTAGTAAALLCALLAAPAHAARAWSELTPVSNQDGDAYGGTLVRTTLGETVSVWTEQPSFAEFVPTLRVTSILPGPIVAPATDLGAAAAHEPPLAVRSAAGTVVVAWRSFSGTEVARLLVAERLPGGAVTPAVDLGASSLRPALAGDDTGRAAVVFARPHPTSSSGRELVLRRRTSAGAWEEPVVLDSVSKGAFDDIRVRVAGDGAAVATWRRYSGDSGSAQMLSVVPAAGPVPEPERLGDDGEAVYGAELATDGLGNAVAAWGERAAEGGYVPGELRYAVREPGSSFGASRPLGGTGNYLTLASTADGVVTAAWNEQFGHGPGSYQRRGMRIASGRLPAGFGPPSQPVPHASPSYVLAPDDDGNLLVAFEDSSTMEPRVARRSAAGLWGRSRPVTCDALMAGPVSAVVDEAGTATVLWQVTDNPVRANGTKLTQDRSASEFAPEGCVYDPVLRAEPEYAEPGQPVVLDATGINYRDIPGATFAFDLDGDGTFERDADTSGRTPHTFAESGMIRVGVRVTYPTPRPGQPYDVTSYGFLLGVGDGRRTVHQGLMMAPTPPSDPDERPWPVAEDGEEAPPVDPSTLGPPVDPPGAEPPVDPPVAPPPLSEADPRPDADGQRDLGPEPDLGPANGTPPTGRPPAVPDVASPGTAPLPALRAPASVAGPTVMLPRRLRTSALLRGRVRVTVIGARGGTVRVALRTETGRLLASGAAAATTRGRRLTLRPRSAALRALAGRRVHALLSVVDGRGTGSARRVILLVR